MSVDLGKHINYHACSQVTSKIWDEVNYPVWGYVWDTIKSPIEFGYELVRIRICVDNDVRELYD